MKSQTIKSFVVLFVLIFIADSNYASNCETTLVTKDLYTRHSGQIYLADCRIDTDESSPFKILPGDHAVLTAEQQIRLGPGFQAQKGGFLKTKFRPCIRNPDENTGYASRGSIDRWMKPVIDAFVENFNSFPLTVELKFKPGTRDIPDFYKDATLTDDLGKDHSLPDEMHGGIDEGVFHFHLGHGGPDSFDVRVGDEGVLSDGTMSNWGTDKRINYRQDMLLGNCNCDGEGCKVGELRYLWLCSCRVFAHGPRVIAGYYEYDEDYQVWSLDPDTGNIVTTLGGDVWKERSEYDRPSEFDGSEDSTGHRNVVERWNSVLSKNMRMACGASTRAHCGNVNHVVSDLKRNYFDDGMSVADSWGHAVAGDYTKGKLYDSEGNLIRVVHVTPLCIARGNANTQEPRSPITDDQRFINKANPYDEAFHVVSWEWDDDLGKPVVQEQVIPDFLPVFVTTAPNWLKDEILLKEKMPPDAYYTHDDMLLSKETTTDGRPRIKVDTRTGAVILAGERKPVRTDSKVSVSSLDKYIRKAYDFIEQQGWKEDDMANMKAVKGILQVITSDSQSDPSRIMKTQKDITFYVGRRIPLETVSPKVFGPDNQIVVQMNNDGTIKNASKRWRKITGKIEEVPVKSYKKAYAEAVKQLENPGLYELSDWDWGYKSSADAKGQEMMVVYYAFTFDPIAAIDDCISQPMVIEIQGHIL